MSAGDAPDHETAGTPGRDHGDTPERKAGGKPEREAVGTPAPAEVDEDSGEAVRDTEHGPIGVIFFWWALAVALFHVVANSLGSPLRSAFLWLAREVPATADWAPAIGNAFGDTATLSTLSLTGIHFAGFAFLCALRFPLLHVGSARGRRIVLAVDLVFGLAVALATVHLITEETALYARGTRFNTLDWIAVTFVLLGALEFTRRTTGWIIPILIVIALTYPTIWGSMIDGIFQFRGLSFNNIAFKSIYSDEGMFGSIARISATFVFMFILFGAFLVRSGAGAFIVDLARAAAGRLVGGPGFVAVLASGLTGTISGSAVANTVSTGVITIPLMKRAGFPPRFAAGVEAAASTGGQIMPPIMGAGAFVMANYTQISYTTIIGVAALPAIVYFLSVAFFVRIEAKRQNLRGEAGGPSVWSILRRGGPSFLIPLVVLIGLLVYGFTPTYAAGIAILSVIVASWLTPTPMGPRAIVEALVIGTRNMITTAILLVSVGLILNVIAATGVGNTVSLMINTWAGGNLMIALVLIALASLVLGMGLPVTASYIVLATLSAPALQQLIIGQVLSPADIDQNTIQALVEGTLAESLKPFFLLADPAAMTALSAPMPLAEAQALYAALPPEVLTQVYAQAKSALDPAIITGALLSAHMAIFWLSQDSSVTPPVCLTAFAAAAIAKTKPMATGMVSWKLAKGLYLMPILFCYTPFLTGTIEEVLGMFVVAVLGVWALGAAIEGHFEAPLNWLFRLALAAAGVALIWPHAVTTNIIGAAVVLAIFAYNIAQSRRTERLAAA